jgi:hypothetical protein
MLGFSDAATRWFNGARSARPRCCRCRRSSSPLSFQQFVSSSTTIQNYYVLRLSRPNGWIMLKNFEKFSTE